MIIVPGQIMFKFEFDGGRMKRIPKSVHVISTVEPCDCGTPYKLLVNGKYCVDETAYNHTWTATDMTPQERRQYVGSRAA